MVQVQQLHIDALIVEEGKVERGYENSMQVTNLKGINE
jgi:hypothetical protein